LLGVGLTYTIKLTTLGGVLANAKEPTIIDLKRIDSKYKVRVVDESR